MHQLLSALVGFVFFAVIFGLLLRSVLRSSSQQHMRRVVQGRKAAAKSCPHCLRLGSVVSKSDAAAVGKVAGFGLLGLLSLKLWHCNNCGYDF